MLSSHDETFTAHEALMHLFFFFFTTLTFDHAYFLVARTMGIVTTKCNDEDDFVVVVHLLSLITMRAGGGTQQRFI